MNTLQPLKKVVYIVSFIDKAVAYEWIVESFADSQVQLEFILLNPGDSYLEQYLKQMQVPCHRIEYNGKKQLASATAKVYRLLKKIRPDAVHAHLFDACIIGLSAAKLAGVKKRIHTRHNGTIHHVYHPNAVKYDRYINYLSTDIVSISKAVTNILVDKEKVNPSKIHLIHHGFRLENFSDVPHERIDALRKKHGIDLQKTVVGVVSRFIEWKGIQYIIPAFSEFLSSHPEAHLLLCGTAGPYSDVLQQLLNKLPEESYTLINFEQDNFALYHLFDFIVHTPVDEDSEAFGQVYVEAMAAGIPMVVTNSGVAPEYIEDRVHALTVPYRNTVAITVALNELAGNEELKNRLIQNAKNEVFKRFGLSQMTNALRDLYVG